VQTGWQTSKKAMEMLVGKRPYSLQKASRPRQRTSKAKQKKGKEKKEKKRTQKFKIQKRLPLV